MNELQPDRPRVTASIVARRGGAPAPPGAWKRPPTPDPRRPDRSGAVTRLAPRPARDATPADPSRRRG